VVSDTSKPSIRSSPPLVLSDSQQLREAFPYDSAPRFLLLDHDAKYGLEVPASMRSLNMTPVRTSIRSP
jgi:hypothetical protein